MFRNVNPYFTPQIKKDIEGIYFFEVNTKYTSQKF